MDRFLIAWQDCYGSSTNQEIHAFQTFYSTLRLTPEDTFAPKTLRYLNHCAGHRWPLSPCPMRATTTSSASGLPPHMVHRRASWHVCDVAFARCVSAACLEMGVAAGGGFLSVATQLPDPDVDMTRRAVPIAPESVLMFVFVLRCALAPAIRRAGNATPDRPECLLSLPLHNLLEHRRP